MLEEHTYTVREEHTLKLASKATANANAINSSPESQYQVVFGILDVVLAQHPTISKLLADEDEFLLVWWDTFLDFNVGLDIFTCASITHWTKYSYWSLLWPRLTQFIWEQVTKNPLKKNPSGIVYRKDSSTITIHSLFLHYLGSIFCAVECRMFASL